jgi:hypothetical protein
MDWMDADRVYMEFCIALDLGDYFDEVMVLIWESNGHLSKL